MDYYKFIDFQNMHTYDWWWVYKFGFFENIY